MVLGKGENKMKAKFKFVSKVSVILFLVLLGVIVLYTVTTKEQEVVLPNALGIIWLILIASLWCQSRKLYFSKELMPVRYHITSEEAHRSERQ